MERDSIIYLLFYFQKFINLAGPYPGFYWGGAAGAI